MANNKTDFDLSTLNRQELLSLSSAIEKQLTKVEKQERKAAMEAAEKAAREHGFSLSELTSSKSVKAKAPAKYRHPENPDLTWSGRGRRPEWIKNAGNDLSAFEI